MKKIRLWFVIVLSLILVGINGVYYITTKETLEKNQAEKVEIIINNVQNSIKSTNKTENYFNQFLAEDLRKSSIAIQNALPPRIEDVTTEQLEKLKEQLGLQGVTLFTQQGDDIVGTKSSNPDQIGLSTKGWAKGMWYSMFHQLLENQDVELIEGFGEKLPNFWSGPVDTSSSDPSIISKWGYYNDGTTNYLINPYVDNKLIVDFNKNAGVNKTIERVIKTNPYVESVAVLNSDALKNGERTTRDTGIVWYSDRLVVFGDYEKRMKIDKSTTAKVISKGKAVNAVVEYKGEKVLKTYAPVNFKSGDNLTEPLVIVVSSDYDMIQDELNGRILTTLIISLILFILGFTIVYTAVRIINKKENTIFNVQGMYKKHIESLFKTIREYRHDFNHHLYTISGLASMGMYTELGEYVEKLVSIQEEVNDIVDVNIPALSGLVQSKKAEARENDIAFEHHFENLDKIHINLTKMTDLVKILGNILDNAFHAVLETAIKEKKVSIVGKYQNGLLTITVYNNGEKIPEDIMTKIFNFGFTTRPGFGGTGIGLASSKKAIERYKGTIDVSSDEDWTKFTIRLPISKKEILPDEEMGE